jgi:hypothetical protein
MVPGRSGRFYQLMVHSCMLNGSFKSTGSQERIKKFGQKLTALGISKNPCWFLNFQNDPLVKCEILQCLRLLFLLFLHWWMPCFLVFGLVFGCANVFVCAKVFGGAKVFGCTKVFVCICRRLYSCLFFCILI